MVDLNRYYTINYIKTSSHKTGVDRVEGDGGAMVSPSDKSASSCMYRSMRMRLSPGSKGGGGNRLVGVERGGEAMESEGE